MCSSVIKVNYHHVIWLHSEVREFAEGSVSCKARLKFLFFTSVNSRLSLQRDEQAFHWGAGEEDLRQSRQTGAGVHRVLHRLVTNVHKQTQMGSHSQFSMGDNLGIWQLRTQKEAQILFCLLFLVFILQQLEQHVFTSQTLCLVQTWLYFIFPYRKRMCKEHTHTHKYADVDL